MGLYLNPPENAIAVSVDEKTSIQALERPNGFAMANSGQIAKGIKALMLAMGQRICSTRWKLRRASSTRGSRRGKDALSFLISWTMPNCRKARKSMF